MLLMISTWIPFITIIHSLELLPQIQTNSIDYWIGNVSPKCAVNIIFYNFTGDFLFNSTYDIPIMLIPLTYYENLEKKQRNIHLRKTKVYRSSFRFLKAECYFSIIYYKLP